MPRLIADDASAQQRSSCEAAGTSGTIGPNLDDTKSDFALVVDRVTNGRGAMPSFKDGLSEQQIADVAQYVVASASG